MSERSSSGKANEQSGTHTTREVIGDWVVYTTVDTAGHEIGRVGYPTNPIISEEFIAAQIKREKEVRGPR